MDGTGLGFWRIATADPDRVAIIDDDGRVLSLRRAARALPGHRAGLHALGLRRGDAIAAILPNHRTFLGTWLAAIESGLYFVPVNSHLAPAEAAFVVANSEAKVLVGHEDLADLCRDSGGRRRYRRRAPLRRRRRRRLPPLHRPEPVAAAVRSRPAARAW